MRRATDPASLMHASRRHGAFAAATIAAVLLGVAACGQQPETKADTAPVPEFRPGFLVGYLTAETLPNSLALLPPPPAAGSAALAMDQAVSRHSLPLRGTPLWTLAAEDADLRFPHAAGAFSCALNAPVSEQETPNLYRLLRRSLTDAGLSTYAAKDHYSRARPFTVNNQPICTPAEETHLRTDGSYPSGHTTVGWAWALILTEIAPDKADAILARGRAFGQSRVVCNVHWESDLIEGRFMAAATVARLHADPNFRADLDASKAELAAVRARGLPPVRDCQAEAAAIALDPLQAP